MKLEKIENLGNYIFKLYFVNKEIITTNLKTLLQNKVVENELDTAKVDRDWQCLEFKDGMVDIEPNTLFNFAKHNKLEQNY
jgi:hypothetical protein